MELPQCSATPRRGHWALETLQCTLTVWGQWAVQLLQCTASQPGGSLQWNSCVARGRGPHLVDIGPHVPEDRDQREFARVL